MSRSIYIDNSYNYNHCIMCVHAHVCICSGDQLHCEVRKVNNTLPPYWEWVQRAKFVGKLEYRNELVDIWDVTVSYSLISATTITIKFWERKVSQIIISNHA